MEIKIEYKAFPCDEEKRILEILTECDSEFLPPLSKRSSTTQSDFFGESKGSLQEYFEKIKTQKILIAKAQNTVSGFMSFIEDYSPEDVYISTVAVSKDFRRMGITGKFYKALIETYKTKNILTRTWSTNLAHTALLKKIGFCEQKRIENDRGAGIDTVYYVYKNKEE